MKSGVSLCVLGLLCLHSLVLGEEAAQLLCDDPSVEKAVFSALHKFNERLSSGHKLALFQILTARKSENGSGSLYSLQFTSRRSDCEAGSKRPWTDCHYLSTGHKKPMPCNATVYVTDAEEDTQQVYCQLDDYIIPERAHCMGCPEDIDENSEDLKVPLAASVSKYNSISNSTHLFNIHTVGHATRQVVAGFRFKLRFDMRKTTCAKNEHTELNDLCVFDEENLEFINCNSTVDVAPWRLEPAQAHIQCESGPLPTIEVSRRRPPGWSPLRKGVYHTFFASAPPATSQPPSPSASKASDKEESSEEDATASKPTTSPSVASANGAAKAVNGKNLHCPSKPWKPFHPANPTVTVTVEVESIEPAADKDLSDTDLLA